MYDIDPFRDLLQQLHLYSADCTAVPQTEAECLGLDNLKVEENITSLHVSKYF